MEDHYFGTIKPRVAEFMADLDEELWKLGILAKTEHNEAAPAQHELAPIFTEANMAIDHNQLTMEIMKKVARRHDLACLLHEKPFEGVNGSGKHDNWSLGTDTGINLFEPGDSPKDNAQFLLFLVAVLKAVDEYQDLLRVSIASANNDHRLGGDEAPPAIVSIFLGQELTDMLETIEKDATYEQHDREEMKVGVHILPRFARDTTDRNRTSPFAFTGNKFEFRMPGSGSSVSGPNVILNTIVAEALCQFADELEQAECFELGLQELIKRNIREHKRIIFNGNNYSQEWVEEAARRGLFNMQTTVDALPAYLAEKNVAVFDKHRIFTHTELKSRFEISLENYCKTLNMESLTMIDMAYKEILPAVSKYTNLLCNTVLARKQAGLGEIKSGEEAIAKQLSALSADAYNRLRHLEDTLQRTHNIADIHEKAIYFKDAVLPAMEGLRETCDQMERITAEEYWPYPTYNKLLFYV